MRKIGAGLVLILIPCLIMAVTLKSWYCFRDWVISKDVVNIAGITENQSMEQVDRWVKATDRAEARKKITRVYNKYWMFWVDENKACSALKDVYDEYGMLWDSWTP